MNKDQVKGRITEVEGLAKEVVGELTGNESLKQEGRLKRATGKMQVGFGNIKNDLGKDK